jgi:acetyl esterase/lipase
MWGHDQARAPDAVGSKTWRGTRRRRGCSQPSRGGRPAVVRAATGGCTRDTRDDPQLIGPGPAVATVHDVATPGRGGDITAPVYEPVADPPGTVVTYHGGGWVNGSVED